MLVYSYVIQRNRSSLASSLGSMHTTSKLSQEDYYSELLANPCLVASRAENEGHIKERTLLIITPIFIVHHRHRIIIYYYVVYIISYRASSLSYFTYLLSQLCVVDQYCYDSPLPH